MSKYIKSFKTKAEYNAYIAGDHATPYTAYVEEEDKYYYGAKEPEMLEFEFPQNPSGNFRFINTLTSVVIPNGVTSISDSAFYSCRSLASITIPDSVTSIEADAFAQCNGFTSITIPNSVTSIGERAFNGGGYQSITVLATTPPTLGNNAFYANYGNFKIYVPAESVEAYKAATIWSTYANKIEAIPE